MVRDNARMPFNLLVGLGLIPAKTLVERRIHLHCVYDVSRVVDLGKVNPVVTDSATCLRAGRAVSWAAHFIGFILCITWHLLK